MLRRWPTQLIVAVVAIACLVAALLVWRDAGEDGGGGQPGPVAAQAPPTPGDGVLRWLGRDSGCLKGTGGLPWIRCRATVRGQYDVSSIALSPDGRFAYGVSLYSGYRSRNGRKVGDIRGGTIVAFARNRETGALRQLPGDDGCIRDRDAPVNRVTAPCTRRARGLAGAKTIVLSPDGRFAYVAALNNDSIAAFRRNESTGALHQLGGRDACVGTPARGRRRECPRRARALHGIRWIAMSPDGRNVYAASPANDAIASFARDPRTGGLRQLRGANACIEDNLARLKSRCSRGVGLNYPRTIAISPDGRSAYVASDSADAAFPGDAANGDAVSAFSRDPRTGALHQLDGEHACIKDRLARPNTQCATIGKGLLDAVHVTVSPDGRHVYVGSHASQAGAIAIFKRDARTSALTQVGGDGACLGRSRGCRPAVGTKGVDSITITPDGRRVYVSAFYGWGVATFSRDRESGALTQLPGVPCFKDVSSREPCPRSVRGLQGPRGVFLSPDATSAYIASSVSGTIDVFTVGRR